MNPVEIEEAVSQISDNKFKAVEFPFEFLFAFGKKSTTIKKLRSGITNKSEIMMIHNQKLSVVPITTHIDIKNIEKILSSNLIIKKVVSLDLNFKKIFNYRAKIGLLGLNPHNGEFLKNSKEKLHIIPSIIKLKKKGIKINLSPIHI